MTALALVAIATLLLSACGSEEETASIKAAQYRAYLEENAASLTRAIQAMLPELENGEVARAESRYVRARVRYAQVEPAAEHFPELDAKINAPAADASSPTGFHQIEKALWADASTAGTVAPAKQMIVDAKELEQKLQAERFTALQLASDSTRILTEIVTSKLAGKEEPYADADLVDVSANLEAVGAAFDALSPTLTDEERQSIRSALHKAYAAIGDYGTPAREPDQPYERSPGVTFIIFSEITPQEIDGIRQPIVVLRNRFEDLQLQLEE